jgi:hypothetical protein
VHKDIGTTEIFKQNSMLFMVKVTVYALITYFAQVRKTEENFNFFYEWKKDLFTIIENDTPVLCLIDVTYKLICKVPFDFNQ